MEKICVAVRVRPPVSKDASTETYWKVEDNRISLHRPHGTPISGVSYTFDHVFDETCLNAQVYELLTKDLIHAAVEGFNGDTDMEMLLGLAAQTRELGSLRTQALGFLVNPQVGFVSNLGSWVPHEPRFLGSLRTRELGSSRKQALGFAWR